MTLDTNDAYEEMPTGTVVEPSQMTDRELLIEMVTGQREIIAFIEQVAKGMQEFQESASRHPILRALLGGNGG